jgi:hypothetical protein
MALKLRPSKVAHPCAHLKDYVIMAGNWPIGRRGEKGWVWSLGLMCGDHKSSDRVATLEEAKAQLQRAWDAWKAWGGGGRARIRPIGGAHRRHPGSSRCKPQLSPKASASKFRR